MHWLWPIRTGITLFDVWTIVHFAQWIFICANLDVLWWKGKSTLFPVVFILAVAIIWEIIERLVFEPSGIVQHPESWVNTWLSDVLITAPLGCLIGLWVARTQ